MECGQDHGIASKTTRRTKTRLGQDSHESDARTHGHHCVAICPVLLELFVPSFFHKAVEQQPCV